MKIVNRTISKEREESIIRENKSAGFRVKFGDKSLFRTLRVTISREYNGETRVFEIDRDYLPENKGQSTNFRLVEGSEGLEIKWCSKVAGYMTEV